MKTLFNIADDIKVLQDGKPVLLGFYPDQVLVLQVPADAPEPSKERPYVVKLSLMFTVIDVPPGAVPFQAVLSTPIGPLMEPAAGILRHDKNAPGNVNLIMNLDLMAVPAAGNYEINVALANGESFSGSFHVRIDRLPATDAQAFGTADSVEH